MSRKYCLTENTIEHNGYILYQIKALRDIPSISVQAGDLGGYIASEKNLSQEGDCWLFPDPLEDIFPYVYENAQVSGNAKIVRNVEISGNAHILDNARVIGIRGYQGLFISDNVIVRGNAEVFGYIMLSDNVEIFENAYVASDDRYMDISDKAQVYGNAKILDNCDISGSAKIYGDVILTNSTVSGNTKIYNSAHLNEAKVTENSTVYGRSFISKSSVKGNADISGNTYIENATIQDNATICGDVMIHGEAVVGGDAELTKKTDIFWAGIVGDLNFLITFYRIKDNQIGITYPNEFSEEQEALSLSLTDFMQFCQQHYSAKIIREFELLAEIAKSRLLT